MPADSGTPIYAIDEGVVIIAGNHTRYYDALVQVSSDYSGL